MASAAGLILHPFGALVFGSLSNIIGRKPIILGGGLLAAISYFPVFQTPISTARFTSPCDIARATLAKPSVNDTSVAGTPAAGAEIKIGDTVIPPNVVSKLAGPELAAAKSTFEKAVNEALKVAGYPLVTNTNTIKAKANSFFDIFTAQKLMIVAILTYQIILATMVYGPIAAMLVELFPTRIRYFGNIYAGLW